MGKIERLPDNSGAPQRVFRVDEISASCAGRTLSIRAGASTNSGGWSQPALRRLNQTDGVASYEVIAMGPGSGPVSMMLQMFIVDYMEADARGILSVRVIAETNEMSAKVSGCAS